MRSVGGDGKFWPVLLLQKQQNSDHTHFFLSSLIPSISLLLNSSSCNTSSTDCVKPCETLGELIPWPSHDPAL